MNVAGWYADPTNELQLRYWDGTNWTEAVQPLPAPDGNPVRSSGQSLETSDASYMAHSTSQRTALSWAILAGGLMIGGGTLLGWLTATTALISVSRDAFQLGANESLTADGPIVLVLGLAVIAMGITCLTNAALPVSSKKYAMIFGLGAMVALGLEYESLHDWVKNVERSSYATASIGSGYWICCVGALVAVIAGALILRSPN